ncbi:putative 3-phytase A precursor [Triangularia setosa]|uniref:3-phytase n=1 Tax=Triangularia setosa TaxID=2587417 RepID=A0AAN6WFE0_9PEZI|nr:putative 3-phytase A precursor [Podospora setosa]
MRNPTSGYAPVSTASPDDDDNNNGYDLDDLVAKPLPPIPTPPKFDPRAFRLYRRDLVSFSLSFLVSLPLVLLLALLTGDGSLFGYHSSSPSATNQAQKPNGKFIVPGGVGVGGNGNGGGGCEPTSTVPQYFNTEDGKWAGPTATGKAGFLAQTREWDLERGNRKQTWVPNEPLQTQVPVKGGGDQSEEGKSIFGEMGFLTPYKPSNGFGVEEWPMPAGAEIVQVQMLSRHGSRYPTIGSNVYGFGERIKEGKLSGGFRAKGELGFLNEWEYELGEEILVPKGRQELFDSGVLHAYMYGRLYNPHSKIIVRTTTQDRMLKSAENFVAGFFGLEWTRNATIEVIIEGAGYNNSLAGYMNCPNGGKVDGGSKAQERWMGVYLQNATERLGKLVKGYKWTVQDTYAAQTMCPYETVAYGFSKFCELFTYEEWLHFGYSIDLNFYGNDAFGSPVGRAIGLGYQQEVVARLQNRTLGYSGSQINVTLDNNTATFPLNQSLYFDFSHDTNIISILAAFGLTQFAGTLDPLTYPGQHNFTVSDMTPFGARLDIEIIKTQKPVLADREIDERGGETEYVHFVLNQRTVHLGWSLEECDGTRKDGWCELGAFLKAQERMGKMARYEEACHGDWDMKNWEYGRVWDGVPV